MYSVTSHHCRSLCGSATQPPSTGDRKQFVSLSSPGCCLSFPVSPLSWFPGGVVTLLLLPEFPLLIFKSTWNTIWITSTPGSCCTWTLLLPPRHRQMLCVPTASSWLCVFFHPCYSWKLLDCGSLRLSCAQASLSIATWRFFYGLVQFIGPILLQFLLR